jgi:hypothetical protein
MKEYKLKVSAYAHVELEDNENIEDYLDEVEHDTDLFSDIFEFGTIEAERIFRRMS